MMRFASRPRMPLAARAGLTLAAALSLAASPAAAEIFKCTDQAGNVTYQNEKCPSGSKAGKVDIFDNNWTASRSEKEAEWQRNAAEHRVITGMPARWVREALGDPPETRETTTAGATELWLYKLPDRNVQVGMLDNQVLWVRETPVTAPAARVAPTPAAAAPSTTELAAPRPAVAPSPATGPPRAAEASPRVTRGRDCREVIAELGPPSRQRELPASAPAGTDAMTEYLYEPSGSSNPERTRILCANGKVEGVDRSVAH